MDFIQPRAGQPAPASHGLHDRPTAGSRHVPTARALASQILRSGTSHRKPSE